MIGAGNTQLVHPPKRCPQRSHRIPFRERPDRSRFRSKSRSGIRRPVRVSWRLRADCRACAVCTPRHRTYSSRPARTPFDYGDGKSALGQFRGTSQRCGTRADTHNLLIPLFARFHAEFRAPLHKMIHRVALQASDGDGLLVVARHHTSALAQHLHRTNAGTTSAQNVCVQYGQRRPIKFPVVIFL